MQALVPEPCVTLHRLAHLSLQEPCAKAGADIVAKDNRAIPIISFVIRLPSQD
jgi:hypothetical protein